MVLSTATHASRLVELGPEDHRWYRFVDSASEATTFHHPAWLRALTESYGYPATVLALLDSQGEVAAGLPLLRIRRPLKGVTLVSLPFTDHCPPLARDEAALMRLAAGLESWLAATGQPALEVRGRLPGYDGLRPVRAGVRHVLSLRGEHEDLKRRMTPAAAKHVRGALRAGVTVRFSRSMRDLPVFYRLHLLTRRRLGAPIQPRRFLTALWRHLVEPGLGFLLVAERPGGEAIAACLVLAHNRRIVYKYTASDASHWRLKPNHLIARTLAEWGRQQGYRQLDFGRTDLEHNGLRKFKASWGAVEVPLEYAYAGAAGPSVSATGRLSTVLHAVITHSPPVVCRAVGELFYRYAA